MIYEGSLLNQEKVECSYLDPKLKHQAFCDHSHFWPTRQWCLDCEIREQEKA